LRDKIANLFSTGLAIPDMIPDVSGICPAMVKFLVFSVWLIGRVGSSGGQEF
jgi:hypothetical protein